MRKILFTLFACCAMWGHAQSNEYRIRGYKGNVELGINYDFGYIGRPECGLLTTHGIQLIHLILNNSAAKNNLLCLTRLTLLKYE